MVDTNSKKQRERYIFDLIYADHSFDDVKDSENPDFLVRYFSNTSYFGVEVTEYYLTETNARIDNMENYTDELLKGRDFKHKDDCKILTVANIDLIDEKDIVQAKNIPAIHQEIPPPNKCAYDVAERIISKACLLKNSKHNVSHTNLIIKDKTDLLRHIDKNNFYGIFFIQELVNAISTAPFREIFFVTIIQNENVYIPLKMLHLIAESYLFNSVIIQNGYENKIPRDVNYIELFAAYLNSTVTYRVLIYKDADGSEVIFGDSGLLINQDNSVTIRSHMDYDIDPHATEPNIKWKSILGDNFDEAIKDYRKTNLFSADVLFPVKKPIPSKVMSPGHK